MDMNRPADRHPPGSPEWDKPYEIPTSPADSEIPATLASEEIHIAGQPVRIGNRQRQRCSWCGTIIDDLDLERMAFAIPPGKTEEQARADGDLEPSHWPVGELIGRAGPVTRVVPHEDGAVLPDGCCGKLDPEVTI